MVLWCIICNLWQSPLCNTTLLASSHLHPRSEHNSIQFSHHGGCLFLFKEIATLGLWVAKNYHKRMKQQRVFFCFFNIKHEFHTTMVELSGVRSSLLDDDDDEDGGAGILESITDVTSAKPTHPTMVHEPRVKWVKSS